jgi:dipeptide/tripeptide permease
MPKTTIQMINLPLFFILTGLNIFASIYFLKFQYIDTVLILFVCFIANQYMLVDGARNLLDDDGNKKRSIIFLTLKFFILIFAFWYAMQQTENNIYIFIGNYIFQLIILGLSIKNDTKKIIKEGI